MSSAIAQHTLSAEARRRHRKLVRRNRITGWLFISPWVVGFLVFALYPFIASFYFSLTNYNILTPPQWIGLRNYQTLAQDSLFWKSLGVTMLYTVFAVPLSTIIAIAIAMLLNMKVRGLAIYRTIFYLPSVVPLVASSIVWIWLFNPSFGLIDSFLRLIGLPGPGWLYSESAVVPALIIMSLWSVGQAIVIYLAGLQGVPTELYEASDLEGANGWQKTWHVTLPMISPVILFNVTLGLIGSFQYFTQAYVMTQGGPNNASLFYALYLYQQAFQYLHLGYASAMAWLLFVVILLATLAIFRSSARWVYYGGA